MVLAVILLFAMVLPLNAGILGDPSREALIRSIVDMRFLHRYTEAEATIDSLRAEFPNDPAPLFLKGSNLHDHMTHREDYRDIDRMNAVLDSAILLAGKDLSDPWNLWIVGSSLGYKAMAEVEKGGYLSAYSTSREALGYLKSAMKSPQTRADAALGAGGYFYWVSNSLGFLTYLPLVPDNRDEGKTLLKEAFDKSRYSRDAAAHALVYVFCKSGELDSARVYRDYVARKYPSSLLPLWYDLSIAEAEKNLARYFTAAEKLAEALDTLGLEQGVNALEIHHYSAIAARDLKLWDRAVFHCDQVIRLGREGDLKSRFKNEIKDCIAIRRLALEKAPK